MTFWFLWFIHVLPPFRAWYMGVRILTMLRTYCSLSRCFAVGRFNLAIWCCFLYIYPMSGLFAYLAYINKNFEQNQYTMMCMKKNNSRLSVTLFMKSMHGLAIFCQEMGKRLKGRRIFNSELCSQFQLNLFSSAWCTSYNLLQLDIE